MNQPLDRLYNLLPAIYRLRDAAEGEPLRALLAAVEGELRLIESDISNLYENWFIETCDEWVVPYIGDLLSTQELYGGNPRAYGQQQRRAYVANTLAYRRRKGTVTVLEQLVRDVTDWRVL
jgi:P2-related tail formation protein